MSLKNNHPTPILEVPVAVEVLSSWEVEASVEAEEDSAAVASVEVASEAVVPEAVFKLEINNQQLIIKAL